MSGCSYEARMPSSVNMNTTFENNTGAKAGSLHEKYSQRYADSHIVRGKDNAMTIGMKFGQATFEDRSDDGELIWAYQAKSSIITTGAQMGTNANFGLFSASSASASNVNTESTSKTSTLRIIFDSTGTVKDFYSERSMN